MLTKTSLGHDTTRLKIHSGMIKAQRFGRCLLLNRKKVPFLEVVHTGKIARPFKFLHHDKDVSDTVYESLREG